MITTSARARAPSSLLYIVIIIYLFFFLWDEWISEKSKNERGGSSAIQLAGPAGCERPRSGGLQDPKSSKKKNNNK